MLSGAMKRQINLRLEEGTIERLRALAVLRGGVHIGRVVEALVDQAGQDAVQQIAALAAGDVRIEEQ